MTENGLFVLGGPETQLHDILWAVHDEKTVVEARARKISGPSDAWRDCEFLLYTYALGCKALGSN